MREYAIATWGSWSEDRARAGIEKHIRDGQAQIIELAGAPIGIEVVERTPDHIRLLQLFIRPMHQRQGIGSELVRQLIQEAQQEKLLLKLRVLKVNPAQRLYQRLGFRVVNDTAEHLYMEYAIDGAMGLRLATVADIAPMHRVRLAVLENRLRDSSRVQPDDYRRMLETDGRGWVYELDGGIVAFAVADQVRRNIWALFVAPRYEGRGIGRTLHDAMVEWLFSIAPGTVWLTTEPATRAERFYQAAGWERIRLERNGEVRFELMCAPSS